MYPYITLFFPNTLFQLRAQCETIIYMKLYDVFFIINLPRIWNKRSVEREIYICFHVFCHEIVIKIEIIIKLF